MDTQTAQRTGLRLGYALALSALTVGDEVTLDVDLSSGLPYGAISVRASEPATVTEIVGGVVRVATADGRIATGFRCDVLTASDRAEVTP